MTVTTLRSGRVVSSGATQAQHVDLYRKLLLRRKLLSHAIPGAVYVPFIGDGDIAAECYADRNIYGADLDAARVATASKRLKDSKIIVANCDGWPFPKVNDTFSVADFDSYSDPYASFRAFWKNADRADRLVLFFTDGHRQAIHRLKIYIAFDGSKESHLDTARYRTIYNTYYPRFVKPAFVKHIGPDWGIVKDMMYLRRDMLYWGCVIERN